MRRFVAAGLLVALLVTSGAVVATRLTAASAPDTQHTIAMRFSHFVPETVVVPAGLPVTFVLENNDPIDHEWIVGPWQVHDRHRLGTEPYHDEIPTEVTVPALTSKTTTVSFDRPGEYAYICHLPGHEAYGMRGVIKVR